MNLGSKLHTYGNLYQVCDKNDPYCEHKDEKCSPHDPYCKDKHDDHDHYGDKKCSKYDPYCENDDDHQKSATLKDSLKDTVCALTGDCGYDLDLNSYDPNNS